ncbi:MAG: hypothetical protein ACQETO_05020 [Pseudomonadota bacterium]
MPLPSRRDSLGMRFFIDNNLPPALAKGLHELSYADGRLIDNLDALISAWTVVSAHTVSSWRACISSQTVR